MSVGERIYETTATTGTGDLTLDGAVANLNPFSDQFQIGQTAHYYIQSDAGSEKGIGHLSDATTFVRDFVFSNSLGSAVRISLTGTSNVYNAGSIDAPYGGGYFERMPTDNLFRSAHITDNGLAEKTIDADKGYFTPYLHKYEGPIDALCCIVKTAAGTSSNYIHLALHDRNSESMPGKRLLSVSDLDPSSTGLKVGTITPQNLPAGWYWVCLVSDVAVRVICSSSNDQIDNGLGLDTQYGNQKNHMRIPFYDSLTELPDPPGFGWLDYFTGTAPDIYLRGVRS